MEIKVFDTSKELGKAAAVFSAQVLNRAIAEKGKARLLMSTGASQFDTICGKGRCGEKDARKRSD